MKQRIRIPLRKAIIKIGYMCNNNCVFCHARSHGCREDMTLEAIAAKMRGALELGIEMVVFSGGEPTVRKDFPLIAREVAMMGVPFGLVTNARMLSYKEYFDSMYDLGLRYALISLHGPDADTHNSLVGTDSFDQTMSGLRRCAEAGISVTVNTVLTRSNLAGLMRMVDLVSGCPGAALKLAFIEPKGAAIERFDELVPDISQAADAVIDAVEYAREEKRAAGVFCDGFTPCLVPDYDVLNDDLFTHGIEYMNEVFEADFFPVDHGARDLGVACGACRRRDDCPGVYSEYLARRGGAELVPIKEE